MVARESRVAAPNPADIRIESHVWGIRGLTLLPDGEPEDARALDLKARDAAQDTIRLAARLSSKPGGCCAA
jgi:hypothetical protein